MSEEFTEYSDFPKAEWMRAGDQFVTVTLRQTNGKTSADQYRKTENVDEVVEAVKNYESKRQKACTNSHQIPSANVKGCEGALGLHECECLQDAYEELMAFLNPYKRYEVEGQLERDNQGEYYLGGYNTPIPEAMADLILEYYEDDLDIQPLVEFWKKCLLNPNEQAREDLFQYIRDYGITITDNGYMMLYKAVTTKDRRVPDDDLAQFVGAEYLKRKNWGKDPADYYVYEAEEEIVLPNNHTAEGLFVSKMPELQIRGDVSVAEPNGNGWTVKQVTDRLGTLEELFNNRDQLCKEGETVMTDKHTQTFEYNLGEAHSEPREECDEDPSIGCSTGLHVGSYDYVSSFGHSPNRDIIQAVLVNPMHVVAIPNHDNSKIRTCEFFSYAIMERNDDGSWEQLESPYFESDYEAMEEEALEERLEELDIQGPHNDDTEADQLKAAQDRLVDLRN